MIFLKNFQKGTRSVLIFLKNFQKSTRSVLIFLKNFPKKHQLCIDIPKIIGNLQLHDWCFKFKLYQVLLNITFIAPEYSLLYLKNLFYSTTLIELITGCASFSIVPLSSVGLAASQIASTTSIPSVTFPNPAYEPSRNSLSS